MLKVVIELHPGGYHERRTAIASMTISNVSDLATISDYEVDAVEAANHLAGTRPRSATCMVVGHDRRQSVWALLEKAATEIRKAEFDEL